MVKILCAPISPCTTQLTKRFKIEFRAVLADDSKEVRFEHVAVG